MGKFAIQVKEIYTRTIVVDADDYTAAEDKIADAYYDGKLILNADNSSVDLELENDTENYVEIFGKKEFEKMDSEI